MHVAILNEVVIELEADLAHTKVKGPLYAAIDNYHGRIENLILEQEDKSIRKDLASLQLLILSIENDGLEQAYEEGKIDDRSYHLYQRYLLAMEQRINRNLTTRFTYFWIVFWRVSRFTLHEIVTLGAKLRSWRKKEKRHLTKEEIESIAELYLANTEVIVESLEHLKGIYNNSLIHFLQEARLRETAIIGSGAFIERVITRMKPNNIAEMMRGYYLERKIIFEYEDQGLISTSYAKYLRQNVNNLENYSLKETVNTLPYDVINYARKG